MKWYPSDPSEACLTRNTAGAVYEEFSCLYPQLPITSWEKNYDPVPVRDWMIAHPWTPIVACLLYGIFIVVGQAYFSTRPAWDWRRLMALWNLGLSIFSLVGFVRVLPVLIHLFKTYSWKEGFCMDPESSYGSGTSGQWVQFFILSKLPELFDTFFIVIHKKKLIFLHWYHHISVLLYCWHSYVTKAPVGIIFCCMNYAVHAIMYFYYFLMAVKMKPKWFRPVWITVAQISQMVVGVAVTVAGWYLMLFDNTDSSSSSSSKDDMEGCWLTRENNLAALIMYGSYLFLFLEFFLQRYFGKKKKQQKLQTKAMSSSNGVVITNGTISKANNNGSIHQKAE